MVDDLQGIVHLKKKIDILRNNMWKKLQSNGGYFGLCLNFINLFLQFGVFKSPKTDQLKLMNIIYFCCTMVSLLLYLIAYCKNKTSLIFAAYAIVALKTSVRLMDFENSRSFLSGPEWLNMMVVCVLTMGGFLVVFC